jgi:hypothetical protein
MRVLRNETTAEQLQSETQIIQGKKVIPATA